MKITVKRTIQVATAVLAAAVVLCLATPTVVRTDKAHGTNLPVKAAMVSEITESTTTTVVTTTPVTTATTVTSTTTTSTSTTSLTSTSTTTTLISTSTSSVEETESAPVTTAEVTEAAPTQAETPREYIVYKPSTHYIHKSTCHWVDSTCYEITDTNDIECRKCSECKPEIEIINSYVEPTPVVASDTGITDYERQLLAEITCHEYGSNWVSTAEKAKIVAGVMNRVYSPAYPNDIYSVLMQDGQFHGSWDGGHGYWPGCITPNEDSWAAVDYYFAHQSEFGSWTSWWGDGTYNHFS